MRYSKKHIAFGHIGLLLLLLTIYPPQTIPEKLAVTFLASFLVSYGLTENLYPSVGVAMGFVCFVALINPLPSDVEYFEEKKEEKKLVPAGEEVKDVKRFSDTETQPVDTLALKEGELEDLLKKDDGDQPKKTEQFTGLPGLDNLLDMAKQDAKNNMAPLPAEKVTPAQAQRQTYQLIDTVKQLKETMESMMPLLTSGKQIMDMYKSLDIPEMGIEKKKKE